MQTVAIQPHGRFHYASHASNGTEEMSSYLPGLVSTADHFSSKDYFICEFVYWSSECSAVGPRKFVASLFILDES
jgi:hypothetical protein